MILRAPRQRVVWLVRHGQTNWNRLGWVQGHLGSPRLTLRGRAQARRVASLLVTKDVRVVYSSDLRRTRCTAEIIAERLACPVRTDARLRERDFGQLEGSPAGALRPEVTGRDRGRVADLAAHPPGGESLDDLAARCADFAGWLEARPNDGDAVTVAHGGSIRLLRAALCGTEPSGMTWGSVANASVHRLVLRSPTPLTSLSLVPTVHTASTRDRPLEETVRSDPFGTDDPPRTHRMVGRPSTPPSELIE